MDTNIENQINESESQQESIFKNGENIESEVVEKVDNTNKPETKSKLEKLKELSQNNKLGGKGSIRRKRIPTSTKKEIKNQFIEKMDELLVKINETNELSSEVDKDVRNKYLGIFYKDFVRRLRKDDRKSSKTKSLTDIRAQLSEIFSNNNYNSELSSCVSQNLNDGAINNLNKVLGDINNILVEKEYLLLKQKEINLSDQIIVQSFKTLDIDFSEPTTATNIRNIYIEKSQSETRQNRLDQYKQSYYVLLKLVQSTYD